MKILQVCPRYYPSVGGVEEHVRNISKRLAKEFEVSVLTTDPSGRLQNVQRIDNVEVRYFKSWAPNEAYFFSRDMRKYLADYSGGYDIVHAHSYHALPALYVALAKSQNKMIFTPHYHGSGHGWFRNLLHVPYRLFGNRILQKADKLVCVSNYEKTLLLSNFNVDEGKVSVIPNGISLQEFKNPKKKCGKNRIILYVGRLEEYKGVHYLIRVLRKLDDDIVLEIVGKGPFKKKLVALAKKEGVAGRVRFYQDLTRQILLQKYAEADLFALLSEHEAFSISVAEALASRTPCVVADTSALTEWVDDRNCFGLSCPIDINDLSTLINIAMGKHVTNLALPNWDDVSAKLARLYRECLR